MQTLTSEQRRQWQADGYLVVPQALDPDEVVMFSRLVDEIRPKPGYEPTQRPNLPIGHYDWQPHAKSLDSEGFMDRRDLLPYHQAFIDLVDRPNVFNIMLQLMGPNILLSMTQAIVRPSTDKFPGYTHTDGGEALRGIRVTESSAPLAVKVMYLLSDVSAPNHGNLTVFPGSHLRPFPVRSETPLTPYAAGAAQLTGKAGDCYIFSHALWHGPAQNRSGAARKTLLYNYCQLFMRQYDFAARAELAEGQQLRYTARQRRLLGDLGYDFRPGSYFYVPLDQEAVMGLKPKQ